MAMLVATVQTRAHKKIYKRMRQNLEVLDRNFINTVSSIILADEDGYTEQDLMGKNVKLTLLEELLLIGIKDEQVHFHSSLPPINEHITHFSGIFVVLE